MEVSEAAQLKDALELLSEVREFMASWSHPAMQVCITKIDRKLADPSARLMAASSAEITAARIFPSGSGFTGVVKDGYMAVRLSSASWSQPAVDGLTFGAYAMQHLQSQLGLRLELQHVRADSLFQKLFGPSGR